YLSPPRQNRFAAPIFVSVGKSTPTPEGPTPCFDSSWVFNTISTAISTSTKVSPRSPDGPFPLPGPDHRRGGRRGPGRAARTEPGPHPLTKRCAAPPARHHFEKRVSDTGRSLIAVDTNPFAKNHAASLTFTTLGPRLEASRAKWRRRPLLQPCFPREA